VYLTQYRCISVAGITWQCGLPCPCQSLDHQVIFQVQRNRDNLSIFNPCCEIHVKDEEGWMVVNGTFLSISHNTQWLNEFLKKWTCSEIGKRHCGCCLELCGSKPSSPPSFCLQLFWKSLHKEVTAPKKPISHECCNNSEALTEAWYSMLGVPPWIQLIHSSSLRLREKTSFCPKQSSLCLSSQCAATYQQIMLQKLCFMKTNESAVSAARKTTEAVSCLI
jgi:hypothetical protein